MKRLLLLLCCLGFQAALVIASINEKTDDSDYFIKGKYSQTSISPNGKYLVQIEDHLHNYRLVVSDLDKSEVIYNSKVGKYYPRNLVWISDRRVMYQQRGRLVTMNIDGKEHRVIFKNYSDTGGYYHSRRWYKKHYRGWSVLHTIPGDPDAIITQTINAKGIASVHKTNIFTGDKVEIINGKKNGIGSWQVDQEGRVVSGVRKGKGDLDVYFVEKSTKKSEEKSSSGISSRRVSDLGTGFSSSGSRFLESNFSVIDGSFEEGIVYVSEAVDRDKFQLSKFNIVTGLVTEVVHSDPDYDVGNTFYSPTLHFDASAKKLIGVSYYRSDITTVWFDERFRKFQSTLDAQYPNRSNVIEQWSEDLSKILVLSSSSDSLDRYYVYYPKKNRIVLHSEPTAHEFLEIPESRVVRYSSADGTEHEGYLTLPLGTSNKAPLPTVVMVHGGPWSRYIMDYDARTAYFTSKGYAVLRVNFRGSIGFGKSYLHAGTKNLSELMIDDIADGAKWMISQSYADPDRVYIMGSSYGGYAALMSTVRYPDLYSGAVSFAAPLDLVAQIKHYKKNKNYFGYDFWNAAVGHVKTDRARLKRASPLYNLDNIKVPYLIFHGEDDEVVPVKQAERYKKSVSKAGKTNNVYILRDEGHGFDHTSNHLYYVEKALRLFNQKF